MGVTPDVDVVSDDFDALIKKHQRNCGEKHVVDFKYIFSLTFRLLQQASSEVTVKNRVSINLK